jgi:hypothetical protein
MGTHYKENVPGVWDGILVELESFKETFTGDPAFW